MAAPAPPATATRADPVDVTPVATVDRAAPAVDRAAPAVDRAAPAGLPVAPVPGGRPIGTAAALAAMVGLLVALSALHLTQGTSGIGLRDLLRLITDHDPGTWDVVLGSRLPRLAAGLATGAALGAAGATFQSVARNDLASPEILGVTQGAHLAVTAFAALGLALPVFGSSGVAFLGGVVAAALVMAVSAGGGTGPTRLVLAGSAISLLCASLTTTLLILFEQETMGLYAWGQGSLLQINFTTTGPLAPVLLGTVAALVLLGRRLDLLALGDDAAAVLGVSVRRTRVVAVLLAVLLTAVSVTIVGPVGFVGLSAPTIVRLVGRRVRGLLRHRTLIVASAVAGALVVIACDALLRVALGNRAGVEVPVGVVTSLGGSAVLVALARGHRDSGPPQDAPAAHGPDAGTRARLVVVVALGLAALAGAVVAGLLLGDTHLLLGDVGHWLRGEAGLRVRHVLDLRTPRVLGAVLGGAALAASGATVQTVCRNPLAEPGIIGITAGAGLGAVSVATGVPGTGLWGITAGAAAGALLATLVVYGLSWRGGLSSDRLVLIGVGLAAGLAAATSMVIIASDPWNTAKALTWLSGSTYGRDMVHLVPVAIALAVVLPLLLAHHRTLDLMAVDDDTPRVLGVRLERSRLLLLLGAVALAAGAVVVVGVVGFVGLVAPHAARMLVGGRAHRALPVAVLLGAVLVSVADTVGRTAIAPAQIPAGLVTALIGTPYFVLLLWRSRH